VVDLLYRHLQETMPIIASGGVMTAEDGVEKMQAGAKLVQLYSGFIYKGPVLVPDCVDAIAQWRKTQEGAVASLRP
jgi:dihydroorotate dehydrogenase